MGTLADTMEEIEGEGNTEENQDTGTEGASTGTEGDASDESGDTDTESTDANSGAGTGEVGSTEGESGEVSNPEISELDKLKEDQEELRQMLRATRRENATLRAKVGRVVNDADLDADLDEGEGGEGVKLSRVEQLQNTLGAIGEQRGAQLELLVDQMSEMNKYSDIAEVCSKANVDTVIETAANTIVEAQGGDIDEVMLELEVDVWSRANPYKYLYGIIKAHHPKYATAPTKGKEDSKAQLDKTLGNSAASSIQDMGGSGGGKGGGWTADRIDRLPESELNKVPGDIYEKYLQGILK